MKEGDDIPSIEIGVYEHYKGKRYEVFGIALHTETLEPQVVYRPLYVGDINPDFWVRPYKMFVEEVTVEGRLVPRFTKV